MNLQRIKYLYLKEMREILRNWGLIILLVFFPLIVYPTSLIFMAEFGASQQKKLEKQTPRIIISGSHYAPELVTLLKDTNELDMVIEENATKDMVPSKCRALVVVPPTFEEIKKKDSTVTIDVFFDSTDDESNLARSRISEVLKDYKKELLFRRLEGEKLALKFLEPLDLQYQNVASTNKIAGQRLGEVLPLILVMFIMLGTIQVAVDITAGEKERRTIQTLLLSPLNRLEILTSKLLVVLTTTLFTTAINFLSVGLTIYFVYKLTERAQGISISFSSIGLSLLVSVPLVVLISALFLMVGIMAKNQLEANIYVLPILFVGLLPAGLPSIPGLRYDTWICFVPIANTALTVKSIFLGTCTFTGLAITFLSNAFYAAMVMLFVSRLFQKEDIAFGGFSDIIAIKKDRSLPSPAEVILFFLATLTIYFFVGNHLQHKQVRLGLLISQILLLLVPVFYFIRKGNYNARTILKLNYPGFRSIVLAPLIGWATIIISQFYEQFQSSFIQTPREIEDFMASLIAYNGWQEGLLVFLIIAVTPAVIEELAFRGVILSGLQQALNPAAASLLTGLMFSVFHLNLYILIPVAVMGALITYSVIRTNSIFTGMLIHLTINGTQVLMANMARDIPQPPLYTLFAAILVLVVCFRLLPVKTSSEGGHHE